MRRTIIGGLTLLFGASTALAGPLDGRWTLDLAGCRDQYYDSLMRVDTARNTVTFYESSCTILSLYPVGTQELLWHANLTCSGEGVTWTSENYYGLEYPAEGGTANLIEVVVSELPNETGGYVLTWLRCPGK